MSFSCFVRSRERAQPSSRPSPGRRLSSATTSGCSTGHRAAVDGQRVVRHQRRDVHRPTPVRAAALLRQALRAESQLLRRRRLEMRTAPGQTQPLSTATASVGVDAMPVWAAVVMRREHMSRRLFSTFRAGAEGAADARHAWPLVQRQRCRDIQHLFHRGFRSLGHPRWCRWTAPRYRRVSTQHPSASEIYLTSTRPASWSLILFSGMSTSMFSGCVLAHARAFVYHSVFPSWLSFVMMTHVLCFSIVYPGCVFPQWPIKCYLAPADTEEYTITVVRTLFLYMYLMR